MLANTLFHKLMLALAVCCAVMPARAATRIWLGANSLWSNRDNWSPSGAPQNGDSLSFPIGNQFMEFSMNNDLVNLTIETITFTGAGYTLNGNRLTLNQGITDNHVGALNRVRCDLQFTSGGGRFNSIDVGQLEVSGTTTLANNQDLTITPVTTNMTVSGVIQGNGGLIKRGEGALFVRGSANNTYTGPTRVEGGDMHLAKGSGARAISSNVIIERLTTGALSMSDDLPGQYPPVLSMTMTNGGTWRITNGATVTNLIMSQFTFIDGSGLLTLQCDVTVFDREVGPFFNECHISSAIFLGNATRTFKVNNRAGGIMELHLDGQIIGPGPGEGSPGIIKQGFGYMYLDRPNLYFGPTLIEQGVLSVTDDDALGGTGAGAETRLRGGDLECLGTLTVPERLVLEQSGFILYSGNVTLTGPLTVTNACEIYGEVFQVGVTNPGRVEVSGVIDGPGSVLVRNGNVRMSGSTPNTFGGGVDISPHDNGLYALTTTLELAKANNVLAVPGQVRMASLGTNAGVLRNFQDGGVQDVVITGNGAWQLNGHFVEPRSLAFHGPGSVSTGSGLLVLASAGGNSNVLEVASGTLGPAEIFGDFGFLGPTFDIAISDNSTLAIHAQMGGSANLIRQRAVAGQTLGGTLILEGNNQFNAPFQVEAGLLHIKSATALGATDTGTTVFDGATLKVESVSLLAEPLNLRGAGRGGTNGALFLLPNAGVGAAIVLDADATIRSDSGAGNLSGRISGPGGLTKTGPGELDLFQGPANTFTGPTIVAGGVLAAGRVEGPALSSNVVVSGGSTLRTGEGAGITALPATASVTVEAGGLWTMSPNNAEQLSRLVGNGAVNLGGASFLTVSNSISCTFSGALSGTGALNKRGLATLHVTAQSASYTGPATVFDGTYKVDGYFANSPVTVKLSSILRGSGAVGDVTVENGGVVRVDPRNAGVLGGSMQFNSVNFQSGGVFGAQFYGPDPTGGNDFMYVLNGVTLSTPALSSGFQYPPHEGDVVTLIEKIGAGAISGAFSGFPEGALRTIGQIPVVVSYVGGNGNDVTLTVTNLPLGGGGTQLVGGAGSSVLIPNDCSLLWLGVTNRGATTISNFNGTLRSLTPGVVVTIAEAAFPNLAPNVRGTNLTPFQVRTEPTFPCGAGAQFELVLTGSNAPPSAILYTLLGASGYGLDFDGRDDQVEIPANTFSSVVNNFTIELWANPAANRTQTAETNTGMSGVSVPLRQLQRFAVFPDRGNLAYGVSHVGAGLSIGRNGISAYEQGTNHLPSRLVYSNTLSGWTHVALVYASRQPRLYVNGVLARSGSASIFSSVHPSASLGGSVQGDYGNFQGQLDEVRIWNVALSQSQIQSNMTRRLTGIEPNLVTYFRCDEGSSSALTDSAAASPNPTGTLTNGAAFVLSDRSPFTEPGGPSCDSGGGACESCLVVNDTFTTNTSALLTPLSPEGSPSICFPPKPCPGPFPLSLPPTPYILHRFTNSSGTQACVTAQLRFNCPAAPHGAMHAAAYLGAVDTNNPCMNYLGDSGGDGAAGFSFSVPAGSNVVLLVTLWTPGIGCDDYTLELFGLPCPPPTLSIAKDNRPNEVLLRWSSAYPDFGLQSANPFNGAINFSRVPTPPVLVSGKFTVTNATTEPQKFFRLSKP
jgi:autotransporter-associated beta strand protein